MQSSFIMLCAQCYTGFSVLRKGFKKVKNSTLRSGTHLEVEKNKEIFFSETKPFFEHFFVKSVFLQLKIPKNDKSTFRQVNFCLCRCQILLQHTQ